MKEIDADHIAALCGGFCEPRVMLTAAELDLFTILSGQWLSCEALAKPRQWDPRALRILLDALVVMGLLLKRNSTYSTTTQSSEYLSSSGAYTVLEQALHGVDMWDDWSKLTTRVIGNGKAPERDPTRALVASMHQLTPQLTPGIAALVRPEMARRFLDVGGGSGAYTTEFLRRDRSLQATIFDTPEVLAICAEYLRDEELDGQVRLVPGDLTVDEFPPDMGMVFLSAVVHFLGLEQIRGLFRRCHRALVPGGRVVICDYVMSADRLQPRSGAMYAVNMLVSTEAGEPHTFSELKEVLASTGFVDTRMLQDGERMNAIVESYRPQG